jgi:hypothetical protein
MDLAFYEAALQSLTLAYPNKAFLDTTSLAAAIDSTPNSVRSQLSRGELPIPRARVGSKTLFPLIEVAKYLAGAHGQRRLNRKAGAGSKQESGNGN